MFTKKKKSTGAITAEVFSVLFIIVIIIFTLYPVVYTIFGSFKSNAELTLGESFFPSEWHFENYYRAFVEADFLKYTINSVTISIASMILAVATTATAGYVFARMEFFGKKFWLTLYTGMMFISLGSVTLYPLYSLLQSVGLNKSKIGMVIIMTGAQISNVILVMGFVKTIPKELEEAASIDGCSPFGIFFKIIFPLLRPILAVVALFSFRNSWNDYLTPLMMSIGNPKLKTLTVAVAQLKYSVNAAAEWNIMLAGAAIAIIPVLVLYLFMNKQFIAGLTAGAVKG